MTITKTLNDKDLSSEVKLEKIARIVASLRESYGNHEKVIEDLKVNTTHGWLPFSNLESDAKVEILKNEALSIKSKAITEVENNNALSLNKKVEELLATNAIFANVTTDTGFDLL